MVNQEFATGRRLTVATIVAGALQFAWIGFWIWYLKVPDSVICSRNPDPGGFNFLGACPESRRFAGWIAAMIPFVGPILSILTAVVLFRYPVDCGWTWRRFFFGVPFYAVVILISLIVTLVVGAILSGLVR